ncbi:MAG: glycosyltransferase family 2 protein, partial [bacterium]
MAVETFAAPGPQSAEELVVRRSLEQAIRRALTVLALLPLTVILAVKAAQLGTQLLVNIYGIGVLGSTIVIMYIAFSNYRDPSDDAVELLARPLVSCLVAVRDDVEIIERCVRSLLEQSYGNVEVIVVDDLSSDGTRELLTRLGEELPIRVMLLDANVGKKRALTFAAEQATGDFFVFTDSDCVVEVEAIERCMLAFQAHPGIGAVSGHARALNADRNILTRVQDVWYDGQFG